MMCLGTGTFFESLSLRTGFPFGHYFFTDVMGPKLFQLPVLLALAYLGMGYLSWIVAAVIDGRLDRPISGSRLVTLPLLASSVMVAWDLAMDPVWANLDHAWVWRDGGAWFGVPVSNYLGWLLTVYTFYQAFAIYLSRREASAAFPRSFGRLAVLFYGASAAGNVLLAIPSTRGAAVAAFVSDATGRQWSVAGIIQSCVVTSICVMGGFTITAWFRSAGRRPGRHSEVSR
jgi:putative membrane protein